MFPFGFVFILKKTEVQKIKTFTISISILPISSPKFKATRYRDRRQVLYVTASPGRPSKYRQRPVNLSDGSDGD